MNTPTAERTEAPPEEGGRGRLDERFLQTRTVLIFGEINSKLARDVTEKLLLLSAESDDDIKVIINSHGGHVESGDTIFDMIRFVKPRVKVVGTGWVASAAALIFVAPPLEQRVCLPNTRFLLHQPLGGISGSARDMSIEAEEIMKVKRRLNQIFARQTGQPLETIEVQTDRNFWMTGEEAKAYGLVGRIVEALDQV